MVLYQLLHTIRTNYSTFLSDIRNFDSFGILTIFGYETPGAFVWNRFCTFSLINIIILDFDDHNYGGCSFHLVTKGQDLANSPIPYFQTKYFNFPKTK